MRKTYLIMAAFVAASGLAVMAQAEGYGSGKPGMATNTLNAAVNTTNLGVSGTVMVTSTTPKAGANSYTEAQAQSRIGDAGLSSVSKLTKDANGVWRGTAMHNGAQVGVALDYMGNVSVSH